MKNYNKSNQIILLESARDLHGMQYASKLDILKEGGTYFNREVKNGDTYGSGDIIIDQSGFSDKKQAEEAEDNYLIEYIESYEGELDMETQDALSDYLDIS